MSVPVVVYAPDLLMRQQIVAGVEASGVAARGAATPARFATALAAGAAAAVIELDGIGIDGIELIEQLRSDTATADLPILGFCAHTRAELITGARDAGATKVVARGELVRKLPELIASLTHTAPTDA